jgi:hypothetical protein
MRWRSHAEFITMQATTRALDHLLCAVGDPVAELAHVVPGHPEFERTQMIRAAAGVLAKRPEAFPAIANAIRTLPGYPVSPRTRAHFAAAAAWIGGDPVLAAESYASIVSEWPTDLLAMRFAQSCYFFVGWHDRQCAVVDAAMPVWRRDHPAFRFLRAMASFAHAESGDAAYAEALGREALARNPACPMGVHAVAHAIAESGRHGFGAQWMREQRDHWMGESRMRTHNAWHLAMFDAEEGNFASALGILDDWLLPASAQSPLEACDATGLLWRLATEGIVRPEPVEPDFGRFRACADAWILAPFVDMHAALARVSVGKHERLRRLAQSIGQRALGYGYAALRAPRITQPMLQAFLARFEGRQLEADALLARLEPVINHAGGSRIQLEIFRSLANDAVASRSSVQRATQPASAKGDLPWNKQLQRIVFLRSSPVHPDRSTGRLGYCHCGSCRSWSAAPVNAFTHWKRDAIRVTRGQDRVGTYNKTPRSYRKWCKSCGRHVFTEQPLWRLTDIYAASISEFPFKRACTSITRKRCCRSGTACPSSRMFPPTWAAPVR